VPRLVCCRGALELRRRATTGLLPTLRSQNHAVPANAGRYPAIPSAILLRKLYVTDNVNSDVAVFKHGNWSSLGTITNGISAPYGDWVDRSGNLYVVNRTSSTSSDITEYDSSGDLTFTYSTGMVEGVSVTTDRQGNVYETDQTGAVTEFAQGSNVVTATCSLPPGDGALGVAVDSHRNVFVTFDNLASTPKGGIMVYPHGLDHGAFGCASALLPISFAAPIGIVLDKQGNLVVCDGSAGVVDIIAPPYKNITGTLGSGWIAPYFVSIDKEGTEAYVSDPGAADLQILSYPSGTNVATLGSANGLALPVQAVDSKNYVP
jgi:hypothetical protein